jgi:hypothetical protein
MCENEGEGILMDFQKFGSYSGEKAHYTEE